MIKNLSEHIKKLRENYSFTQDHVAKEIGVSRPTYIQIEKGERELTISEVEKLAEMFDMTLDDLLKTREIPQPKVIIERSSKSVKKETNIRISVPQKYLKKFKEVLLYLFEKVGANPNIGKTAIYKLLYFIDFDYYEKYEEQLVGATYKKNRYGPTPIEFDAVIKDMKKKDEVEEIKSQYFQYDQKKYLPLRGPDLSILTAREITHIDEVIARLSNKSARELSDYSHGDIPWQIHKQGDIISYESVFYRDYRYSVRNYDDEI